MSGRQPHEAPRVLALTGGVGGAKLALGLSALLPPEQLAFIANTGDDFEHLGLTICPDLDTLLYTLADEVNPDTGWGRREEQWTAMAELRRLGGDTWFQLGDRDLATHMRRTQALARGDRLTHITAQLAQSLGVRHALLPMSDDAVRTAVDTPDGPLAFQHYFVRERCDPAVTGFRFNGAEAARLNPDVQTWLDAKSLAGVVICPSNPFVSIDPILAVPGMRAALAAASAPVVAVSPIVAGGAVKGPTAKMMRELGVPRTPEAVARHYAGVIDAFVLDERDADQEAAVTATGVLTTVAPTVMATYADKIELARMLLSFLQVPAAAP